MKKIILILCAFALVVSLIAFYGRRNQEMEPRLLRNLWAYARELNFVRLIVIDGEEFVGSRDAARSIDGGVRGPLGSDSIVFAHITFEELLQSNGFRFYPNEVEARAAGHSDDVILAWPHEGAVQGISNAMYLASLRWGGGMLHA